MKSVFALLVAVLGQPAFACVDISGTYLYGSRFYFQYAQNGCVSLTESLCGPGGKDCSENASWPLDGQMTQEGGNPSNWASIIPEGNALHRTQLWDLGTVKDGRHCWWKEQWYSKAPNGDLKIRYKLNCSQASGHEKVEMTEETWQLVH